jgi:hypothetical protein
LVLRVGQLRFAWSSPEWVVATSLCQSADRYPRPHGILLRDREPNKECIASKKMRTEASAPWLLLIQQHGTRKAIAVLD